MQESSMRWSPVLTRVVDDGHVVAITLGHPLVDDYLVFVGARLRHNSWLATAFDLKVFFSVVDKAPASPAPFSSLPRSSGPRSSGSTTTPRPRARWDVRRSLRACSTAWRR